MFYGLTALLSAPETRPAIMGIVIGSTMKGILTGLVIGYVATRTRSLPIGLATGLVVGLALAYLVTLGQPYFWEIMLPGAIVGLIIGYATFVSGGAPSARWSA